jgi:hypothetical protein
MTDVAARIAEILDRRRTRLPLVQEEITRWRQRDDEIEKLGIVVQEMRTHARTSAELKESLAGFQVQDLRKGIAEILELLTVVEARYARGTINIGVSGQARVGKSTLLQAVSGLDERQIPTGSGLPVTAVRSRIFHSDAHRRATLLLHSFDTFRDDVLRPYHDELGLVGIPSTVEEFRTWPYPKNEDGLTASAAAKHSSVTVLRRLRDMQGGLRSFEKDLTGGERTVDLDELRQFVAYPTNQESRTEECLRRYLAVRDARIDCPFPRAPVEHVGIIDLPGLGELAANAEKHHLRGLKNEVDLVLLVKRPVEGMAYWGRADGNTTNLLDEARGFIKNRRDFVFIVINSRNADDELAVALRDDIRRQVNDGDDGKHFRVLEANASSQESVYEGVLAPVLQHLTERLPVMDQEVFDGTRSRFVALTAQINSSLSDLESKIALVSRSVGSPAEDVAKRSRELRKDLAGALGELVGRLKVEARAGEEEPDYLAAVESAYEGIRGWVQSGFDMGSKEAWIKDAARRMIQDSYSSGFAGDELNRIRVEISKRYGSLDIFFRARVDQLWAEIASVLAKHLGDLLEGKQGAVALRGLNLLFVEASEPCSALSDAIRDLLALRVEYRSYLHPKVRRELDLLNLQVIDLESGKPKAQIMVNPTLAGAEELFRFISELAEQAAYYTKKALVREALTSALILHAAAEQFEDTLIRSGNSELEFWRMGRSYRDEIWPGVFTGIGEASARFAKVSKAIRAVRNNLGDVKGGNA